MKIIVLPGVGFQNSKTKYEDFCQYLRKNLNCEAEMHYWKHDWPLPDITLPFKGIRKWTYEVMLDFQQVILHAFEMQLPPADYYIGHSAGSILALVQKNASCVIFGSPAALVECVHRANYGDDKSNDKVMIAIRDKTNIFNIINKFDQLAYYLDLPNVENYVFRGNRFSWKTYEPIECHNGYWEDEGTRERIVEIIKRWEIQK